MKAFGTRQIHENCNKAFAYLNISFLFCIKNHQPQINHIKLESKNKNLNLCSKRKFLQYVEAKMTPFT